MLYVKVAQNTGVIIFTKIITIFIQLFITCKLARFLGPEGYGSFAFVFAYLAFFDVIVNPGLDRIVVREISKNNSRLNEFIGNVVLMKTILAFISVALACFIAHFLDYSEELKKLIYVAELTFFLSAGMSFQLAFEAHLQMVFRCLTQLISKVLLAVLIIFAIHLKASLLTIVCCVVFSNFIEMSILWLFYSKKFGITLKVNLLLWRYLFREGLPLALSIVMIAANLRVNQLMLAKMTNLSELGHYVAAFQVVEAWGFLPSAFMLSIFPLLSDYSVNSAEKFQKVYQLSFKYMSALSIPMAVGICTLAEPCIRILYGTQFDEAVGALKILAWSMVFMFVGAAHYNLLISVGYQKLDCLFTGAGLIINLLVNYTLIPFYGIEGAAIGILSAQGIGAVISPLLPQTRRFGLVMVGSMIKPFLASIVMGLLLSYTPLPLTFQIVLGVLTYLSLMFLIKGFDSEDVRYWLSALKKLLPHLRGLRGRHISLL